MLKYLKFGIIPVAIFLTGTLQLAYAAENTTRAPGTLDTTHSELIAVLKQENSGLHCRISQKEEEISRLNFGGESNVIKDYRDTPLDKLKPPSGQPVQADVLIVMNRTLRDMLESLQQEYEERERNIMFIAQQDAVMRGW